MEDTPRTDTSQTPDAVLAAARVQALEEAAAEARRIAKSWRDEVDGTHSSHHSDLRRTWADAAEKVGEAIAGLAQESGAEGSSRA